MNLDSMPPMHSATKKIGVQQIAPTSHPLPPHGEQRGNCDIRLDRVCSTRGDGRYRTRCVQLQHGILVGGTQQLPRQAKNAGGFASPRWPLKKCVCSRK